MYTIQEVANRIDKNHAVRKILEVASKMNSIYSYLQWVPANSGDHHTVLLRASLPAAAYSRYNQGVLKSNTRTVAIREKLAKLEVSTEIEKKLLMSVTNPEMFRFQNVLGCKQGMINSVEDKIFFEQVADEQDGFDGLFTRYTDLTSPAANQIVNGLDNENGKQTHIFLVKTGEGGVRLTYPEDGQAGMKHTPHPERAHEYTDDDGNKRVIYKLDDDIEQNIGLVIEDWRSVAHGININIDKIMLPPDDNNYQALFPILHQMSRKIDRSLAVGEARFYMPEKVLSALDVQNRNDVKFGGQLKYEVIDGKRTTTFAGYPISISDSMLTNMNPIT